VVIVFRYNPRDSQYILDYWAGCRLDKGWPCLSKTCFGWFLKVGGHVTTLEVSFCGGNFFLHVPRDVPVWLQLCLGVLGRLPPFGLLGRRHIFFNPFSKEAERIKKYVFWVALGCWLMTWLYVGWAIVVKNVYRHVLLDVAFRRPIYLGLLGRAAAW